MNWEDPKKSKLSKEYSYTFDKPGIYLYQCTPHKTMGMIALVVVGEKEMIGEHNMHMIHDAKGAWQIKEETQGVARGFVKCISNQWTIGLLPCLYRSVTIVQ